MIYVHFLNVLPSLLYFLEISVSETFIFGTAFAWKTCTRCYNCKQIRAGKIEWNNF